MVADRTAPPCSSYHSGKSVPPPTKLIRSGARAWTTWCTRGSMERTDAARLRDRALKSASLLLGQPAPHAVALPVLERPGEADLPQRAAAAERQGRPRLF